MRIAIFISHPIQYYSPIFRALSERCDLHVFYGQQLTAHQHSESGFGTNFHWDVDLLGGYKSTFLRNISSNPGPTHFGGCDTPEINVNLRTGGFDALVVTGWYLKSHIQALFAAKRFGIPVLVRGDSHLDTPQSALKRQIKALTYPSFLRLYDGALYVGQKSRLFYEYYRYPSQQLFFSPHCVDNDWFSERATADARAKLRNSCGIKEDVFLVLFAGKLLPFKCPLDVIAAAAKCREVGRDVQVMVAGSGELECEMRSKAAEASVPLHMLGFCNQSQMPSAYAAADALILPSNGRETWGLVANEALACGKPVIVSEACGCAPDLAADGKSGRTVAHGDIAALAAAVAEIMDHPLHTSQIRARSNRYSIAQAVDGIILGVNASKMRADSVSKKKTIDAQR